MSQLASEKCTAITLSNVQCSRNAESGTNFCWQHKTTANSNQKLTPTQSLKFSPKTTTNIELVIPELRSSELYESKLIPIIGSYINRPFHLIDLYYKDGNYSIYTFEYLELIKKIINPYNKQDTQKLIDEGLAEIGSQSRPGIIALVEGGFFIKPSTFGERLSEEHFGPFLAISIHSNGRYLYSIVYAHYDTEDELRAGIQETFNNLQFKTYQSLNDQVAEWKKYINHENIEVNRELDWNKSDEMDAKLNEISGYSNSGVIAIFSNYDSVTPTLINGSKTIFPREYQKYLNDFDYLAFLREIRSIPGTKHYGGI